MTGPFLYLTDCINSTAERINEMRDHPRCTEVSYRTMRRRCGDLAEHARSLGYDRWLTLEHDWHVAYYRSWFAGMPCYFMVWSAIEQVFTPGGVGPEEWTSMTDRDRRGLLPNWRGGRTNQTRPMDDLPVMRREPWPEDGTTLIWRRSPFPYGGRKPWVASRHIDDAIARGPVEIPLDGLLGSQSWVTQRGVELYLLPAGERRRRKLGTPHRRPPIVVQYPNGERFIQDGHHRLAAEWLRGKEAAQVFLAHAKGGRANDRKEAVLLLSGGMDSVILASILERRGYDLTLAFMSHRGNVGNVTKKELAAASKLAEQMGRPLLIFKPESASTPPWYDQYGLVVQTDLLPVQSPDKDWRNRRFLEVLHQYGMADGDVALGVFGTEIHERTQRRADDVTQAGLQGHLHKIGGAGTILTMAEFGDKVGALKALQAKDRPRVLASESCLMWFNTPCGDCWSCMDRVKSITAAWGKDGTPYRVGSKAGRFKAR